ncbi:MAG: cardiolipin synthase [Planctomycetes bacterium]|nr:cardiolipin synthase [Planctomycetota bacterium]
MIAFFGIPTELWVIGYDLAVVATLLVLALRRRETSTIYGWALAIVFLPILGMLLFFLVGLNRVPRRLQRRRRHAEIFASRMPEKSPRAVGLEERRAATGWRSLPVLAEHLGAAPMREGNAIAFFDDGREVFRRIFQDIANAKHHVHLEKYIFRSDHLGMALIDLLIERCRAGVEVRVLIDALGALGTSKQLRRLREAGGRTARFLPLFAGLNRFAPNLRNHRKIVICDGAIGFVGGLNVGDEYLGRRFRDRAWYDAHLRIEGPAVADLQRVFVEDWDFAQGEMLSAPAFFPQRGDHGHERLQIVPSGPDLELSANRSLYFTAASLAREQLRIASPYVVPDAGIRDALVHAAMRGVRVSLLTQGWPPDKRLPYRCARFYFEDLLAAGVRIYEYLPGMMHAKMLVADQAWASVGTSNLDSRSFRLNFEVDATSDTPSFVARVAARFDAALRDAREVDARSFAARPLRHRLGERIAHLFAPLL